MFVLLALTALLYTALRQDFAPLDRIKISGAESPEGRLLGHQDGYWYYFDSKGTLVVVTDEDAKHVEVYRSDR